MDRAGNERRLVTKELFVPAVVVIIEILRDNEYKLNEKESNIGGLGPEVFHFKKARGSRGLKERPRTIEQKKSKRTSPKEEKESSQKQGELIHRHHRHFFFPLLVYFPVNPRT